MSEPILIPHDLGRIASWKAKPGFLGGHNFRRLQPAREDLVMFFGLVYVEDI